MLFNHDMVEVIMYLWDFGYIKIKILKNFKLLDLFKNSNLKDIDEKDYDI